MEEEHGVLAAHGAETMAPALIAVHPHCAALVVAIGATLRIFDFEENCPVTVEDQTTPSYHGQAIRTITFNREGNLFASAGDDKRVKIWDTRSWKCTKTVCLSKKVTRVTFSQDSECLLFADKFGVVYVLPISTDQLGGPVQLLAHCCSIITDLKVAPDGKHVVTSDRDFKIRVSVFPAVPTAGSHEIWSYCLGHTSFVTSLAFVGGAGTQQLLVSGGGDGTVRLWDYKAGEPLDTYFDVDVVLKTKLNRDEGAEENNRAVIDVSVSPAGSEIAVIIERYAGVLLLKYDGQLQKLQCLQVLALSEQVCTTGVAFDARGRLWLAAGAAEIEFSAESVTPAKVDEAEAKVSKIGRSAVVQVRLIITSGCDHEKETTPTDRRYVMCNADSMPGGQALLHALQSGSSIREPDNATFTQEVAMAAEAAELAMRKLMTKRQYTVEQRENRKRLRNDKKFESKGDL